MTRQFFIVSLFFLSLIIELSFIHALTLPVALIPFHFLVGVIVMHRSGVETGALWFVASAFLLPLFGFDSTLGIAFLAVAVVGPLLTTRVFTTHSVYALEGLGLSLFFVIFFISAMFQLLKVPFSLNHQIYTLLFLVIGLYLGFFVSRLVERLGAQFIVLDRKET